MDRRVAILREHVEMSQAPLQFAMTARHADAAVPLRLMAET
jgi:hypothetical protein